MEKTETKNVKRGRGRPPLTKEQQKKAHDARRKKAHERRKHEKVAKDIANILIDGDENARAELPIKYGLPKDINAELRQYVMGSTLKWMAIGNDAPKDAYELAERTELYFRDSFECGDLLTWEKYCLSIGYSRQAIGNWMTGYEQCPLEPRHVALAIFQKAKDILANYDAEMLLVGKLNPVSYIFRAKNYYGMKDVQEKVTLKQEYGSGIKDVEALRRKYIDSSAYDEESE